MDPDEKDVLFFTVSGDIFATKDESVFERFRSNRQHDDDKLMLTNSATLTTKSASTLDLTVSDGILEDKAQLNITVLNVNDVTVEDVSVVSTGGTTLQPEAAKKFKSPGRTLAFFTVQTPRSNQFDVSYGRIDKNAEHSVQSEIRTEPNRLHNTVIYCDSAPGLGRITSGMSTFFDRRYRRVSRTSVRAATPVVTSIRWLDKRLVPQFLER